MEITSLPGNSSQTSSRWYAVHTMPRHEKRVQERLEYRGLRCFLPVYTKTSRWNNGCTASVEFPLFPTYMFVELAERAYARILIDPGVRRIVGTGREPVAIPHSEIESLQRAARTAPLQPHDYLTAGETVRITRGPLAGLTGILIRKNSDLRVVLQLDLIRQGASVEVALEDVEPFSAETVRR